MKHLIAITFGMFLMIGCGSVKSIYIKGVDPMNLNFQGESTPVDVRIYQLRDDKRFNMAQFEDLWTKDEKVLGDDKLSDPTVTTLYPGNKNDSPRKIDLGNLKTETRYLGILALYLGKGKDDHKRHMAISLKDAGKGVFTFTDYKIQIQK